MTTNRDRARAAWDRARPVIRKAFVDEFERELGASTTPEPPPPPPPPTSTRERIEIGGGSGLWKYTKAGGSVQLEHKEFVYVGDRNADTTDACGAFLLGDWDEVLIRDCGFRGFKGGIVAQGDPAHPGSRIGNLEIEDCDIEDTTRQGLYAHAADRIRVRRNHFIRCGAPTILDHAIYIQATCGADVVVDDNAMLEAGSHAAQLRSGGEANRNLVARCPLGLQGGGGTPPKAGGVAVRMAGNVVCEGRDIGPADSRGIGFILGNVVSAELEDNLLWQNAGRGPASLWLNGSGVTGLPGVGVQHVRGPGNRVVNWKWGVRQDGQVSDVTTSDWDDSPGPTLSLDALLGADWIARLRSRELTVPAAIAAVRGAL